MKRKNLFAAGILALSLALAVQPGCKEKEPPNPPPTGGGPAKKYLCKDGNCFESDSGIYNSMEECQKACPPKYSTVTDTNGNVYKTVRIGNQNWMAENLRVTRFNDFSEIPYVSLHSEWTEATGPARIYNWNVTNYLEDYGYLYNFHVVTSPKKVCPRGWHVPTKTEWETLINHLGGPDVAGQKMKDSSEHWSMSTKPGNNSSGFGGRPAGMREVSGAFADRTYYGFWWSSTAISNLGAYGFRMIYLDHTVKTGQYENLEGICIRCIQDQ